VSVCALSWLGEEDVKGAVASSPVGAHIRHLLAYAGKSGLQQVEGSAGLLNDRLGLAQ
jgi:hypothetical protein